MAPFPITTSGHRYYSPALGRWPSRDPITERGGLNLFAFVRNRPVSLIDLLGLDYYDTTETVDATGATIVELVRVAGDLSEVRASAARAALTEALTATKSFWCSAGGYSTRIPTGLGDKIGALAKAGDKIVLPSGLAGAAQAIIDIASLSDFGGAAFLKSLQEAEAKVAQCATLKKAGDVNAQSACEDACLAMHDLLANITVPGDAGALKDVFNFYAAQRCLCCAATGSK